MTDKAQLQITEAEWEVMQSVWEADEQTPADIIARVRPIRDRSHRTIRTLLNRLVEKGAIRVHTDGSRRLYTAEVSKDACVRAAAKSFGERFFGGSTTSLVMHFVENESLSPDEVAELRERLDEITKQPSAGHSKSKASTSRSTSNRRSKQ